MKFILIVLSCTFLCTASWAQNSKEYILEDFERAAGYFHHYETPAPLQEPLSPEGYEAFYISHFGRHGCRWHTSGRIYDGTCLILKEADAKGLLTSKGKEFLEKAEIMVQDASGMLGELSPRGTREHKAIAARMYDRYPEVFKARAKIDSRSTQVVRCILSMAAFDESLKEKEPELQITRESSKRGCAYFFGKNPNIYGKESNAMLDSLKQAWLDEGRFMRSIFKDGGKFMEGEFPYPEAFMFQCYELANITQCCDHLGIGLYDLFTKEEIYDLWKCLNAHAYLSMGSAYKYSDYRLENAKPLLSNIIETADAVINGESDLSASLRFGHDSNIMPLLALMGVKEAAARVPADQAEDLWNVTKVSPMATNLQFIFFKNKKGDVKTRVLFMEKDAALPLEGGPFYSWESLKAYFQDRIRASYHFTSVGVEEFLAAAKEDGVTLIDVRTPEEHAEGYIPGTDLNLNVKDSNFEKEIVRLLPAGSKTAIYCRSGRRSKAAAEILNKNGFEVVELSSGYNGWAAQNR